MLMLSVGALIGSAMADAESLSTQQGGVLTSKLIVPGVEAIDGSQQLQLEQIAQLEDPAAVNKRAVSRSRFEDLDSAESVALARRTFGIARPDWTTPGSNGEGKITKYLGENRAVEVTKSGKKLLVSSTVPLRSAVGSGRLAPVSLALDRHGNIFAPSNPLVPASISKTPAGGVSLPLGISFAPSQAAAPQSSVVVGDSVVYPGTATDTDFMVEPTPSGVEASWQLLSEKSPTENSLRFSLPEGASLRLSRKVSGAAEVVREGQALALIAPAIATEADGSALPVSYSVSGETLTTHVDLGGSVAFPVLVDPVVEPITGYYGVDEGADGWARWTSGDNCGGCMPFEIGQEFLKTSAPSGTPAGATGQWYVYAPGAGEPGGAGIASVILGGVKYFGTEQTYLSAEIGLGNGSDPIWTYNGVSGPFEKGSLTTQGPVGEGIAFCAQGAGGHEGGTPGLCSESYSGQYFTIQLSTLATTKASAYYKLTAAVVRYLDTTAPNEVQIYNVPSGWRKQGPASSVFIAGHDQGVGVQALSLEIPPGHLNAEGNPFFAQESGCSNVKDFAGCPQSMTSSTIDLSGVKTGEWTLGAYAYDAVGNVSIADYEHEPKLYVDNTPPAMASFGGTLSQHANGTIGAGSFPLTFSAEDGSTAAPQSGVRSLKVAVDGKQVEEIKTSCPEPTGKPAAGCFSLSGSWTMDGEKYGAGTHTVTVTATDWAGNETPRTLFVTVNEAESEPVGPGSVNLTTGDFKLSATDVSIASAGADLTVSRTYDSRRLSEGAGGPLGVQWSLNLPELASGGVWRSLRPVAGGVRLTAVSGESVTFASSGETTFVSPGGYQTLQLVRTSTLPLEYQLTDGSGNVVIFRRPGTEEESAPLVPAIVEQASGAGGLNKVTYVSTRTAAGITEPTEIIAPAPAGLNCASSLVDGCRVLEFKYASSTTASGESKSQWGDYNGALKEIKFVAWSSSVKQETRTVAKYAYDSLGRLRSETDPEEGLTSYYGYDSEGHVTAVTAPGLETWALTYGSATSDAASVSGRLLKALQAPPATPLWSGETPANSEAPAITGTPAVGVRLAASKGTWSGNPVAIGYTWLWCNSAGGSCERIPGANGPNYTLASSDVGHEIEARVAATNGAGTLTATSSPTAVVQKSMGTQYEVPGGQQVRALTAGPDGNVWFSGGNNTIGKVGKSTTAGAMTQYGVGAFPEAITAGTDGNLWFVDKTLHNVDHATVGGVTTQFSLTRTGTENVGITSGFDKNLWFTESGTSYIGKISTADVVLGEYALPAGSQPRGITSGPDKNLWFTDYATNKIGKITTAGTITNEYALPSGSKPIAITAGADGNLWFADYGTNAIGKITTSGTISEYPLPSGSQPSAIASGPDGNVWFTDEGTAQIGKITPAGVISEYPMPSGSKPNAITTGPDGNVWYSAAEPSKLGKLTPPVEGALLPPSPGTTIEYNVPLSGPGLQTMTSAGVQKWAQGPDVPEEATAIFPPDEPESWPANDYRRATVFYLDSAGHAVNVATPNGAVSTQEYDSHDDPTRSLSADNRAAALNEGTKSSEAAKPLYFERKYNTIGTEQLETLGPEHKVKLPSGSEVSARKFVKYTYNEEGAPAGGPYRLPTETTEAALTAGKQEDLRTVTNSYSGQEGLGWKLHAPTSTTVAPGSLHLVHSATYNPTTGAETETAMPGAASKETGFPVYFRAFGKAGGEAGQLHGANAVATDSSGNVWVSDSENNRIEEFTATGAFSQAFGWGVLNGKEELQDCKTTCRAGLSGTGNGQFKGPQGIAYSATNSDLYVSDGGNNRVEVFTTAGVWVKTFGETGKGNGQFSSPHGLTTDSSGNVWVADQSNSRVEKFNAEGIYQSAFGKEGTGNAEFSGVGDVTICGGHLYAVDTAGQRVEELTTSGTYITKFGTAGTGNGQFTQISRIACNPANGNLYVTDKGGNRVEVFNATGTFLEAFGTGGTGAGQMNTPIGVALSGSGNAYVVDSANNRVQQWVPSISGNAGAFKSQTIYYSPKTEASVAVCQNRPEWANLPCQVQPAQQPESSEVPALPTTDFSYNVYDEPAETKSTNGAETRTETEHYDPAGRLTSKEIASTTGEALPKITYTYSTSTGLQTKQSTGAGAEEKAITEEYNNLGQLASYTDSDGATTSYEYEKEGDYRLLKTADPNGSETLGYDTQTTGLPTSLKTSSAGTTLTFAATYDPEGNRLTETLPGGLKVTTTLNPVDEAVGLKYVKETHCTTGCEWYSDNVTPSIRGQWMSQASTNEADKYAYNEASWLTETQTTPTGKACAARNYSYDADGNRIRLTKHACGAEGGETETHAYDTADRLLDAGTTYNPFGDITNVPAADIEGAALSSKYFVDGQLSSQEQSAQTVGYALDPARRTRETVSVGHTTADITNHYDGPGSSPSWTTAISGETTRQIPGLAGALEAIQHGTATPELQIANLHGDIIGTMPAIETATGLTASPNTTEYGVPTSAETPKYSWLGADALPTELASGAIDMGARSYVPQLGRFLQPDPQPGGSVNAYAYTSDDPVNESDPSGEWSLNQTSAGASAAETGEGETLAGGTGIAATAKLLPPPDVQAEEALAGDAPSDTLLAAEAPVAVGRARSEGDGLGLLRIHGDPGLPQGAQCEGAVNSKRYKREHPKLCHESENQNPWEPAEFLCDITPGANIICVTIEKTKFVKRIGH
jgi:RHS repeat-associated protein